MMIALLFTSVILAFDPVAAGDAAFERERYDEAIRCYQSALNSAPLDAGSQWKLARAIVCRADVSPEAEQPAAYRAALQAAEKSLALDPHSSSAHTWYAIALGYVAIGEGVRSQIRIAHRIKAEVAEAIRLDASNDVAYSIQGTLFRNLGNVGWMERQLAAVLIGRLPDGGYPEAEQALRKAVTLAPGVIRHRYELGLLYLDWGKNDEARVTFRDALTLKPVIASDKQRIADMTKRLQKL